MHDETEDKCRPSVPRLQLTTLTMEQLSYLH